PGDAREGRLFRGEMIRHLPPPPAFVADGQELVRRMVAGVADAVARLQALDVGSDGHYPARGAVSGPEGKLPVRHLRVFQPLVAAGVNGQLGPGADRAGLALDEDLVRPRVRQVGVADLDLVRLNDGGLTCFHGTRICGSMVR